MGFLIIIINNILAAYRTRCGEKTWGKNEPWFKFPTLLNFGSPKY